MKKLFSLLQVLLYLVICILYICSSDAVPLNTCYAIYALFILSFIAVILERTILKKKNLAQIITSSVAFVLATMLLFLESDNTNEVPNYVLSASLLCLVSCVLIIVDVTQLLLSRIKEKATPSKPINSPLMQDNQDAPIEVANHKYLPVGSLSKGQAALNIGFIFLIIILAALFVYLTVEVSYWFAPLSMVLIFIVFLGYVLLVNKIVMKPFIKYTQTLDFETFSEEVFKVINDEKIHPETRNYYLMEYLTYANNVDKTIQERYISSIFVPKNASYVLAYDVFQLNCSLEEWENVYQALKEKYQNNKRINSQLERVKLFHDVVYNQKTDIDIDALFPLKGKNKLEEANNLFLRVFYYHNLHDEKWMTCSKQFKELYPSLKESIKRLEELEKQDVSQE